MKIGVFGAGAWGTALAYTCVRSGNEVVHWAFKGIFDGLSDLPKPDAVTRTEDMADLKDTEYWLIVTPSAFFRETVRKMRAVYNNQPILICTKGMEGETGEFMTEILNSELPECTDFGVLSGPQFAREVATGVPTGSTIAGNERVRAGGHIALSALYLQDSDDFIGAQLCGVGKNADSLISGYMTVKGQGENERALVFTLAWNEIAEIGAKMGAECKSFIALCGVGDLFLSATSTTSRNFSAGQAIARGEPIVANTVEGIFALRGLIHRAEKLGVQTPVLCEMRDKMGI